MLCVALRCFALLCVALCCVALCCVACLPSLLPPACARDPVSSCCVVASPLTFLCSYADVADIHATEHGTLGTWCGWWTRRGPTAAPPLIADARARDADDTHADRIEFEARSPSLIRVVWSRARVVFECGQHCRQDLLTRGERVLVSSRLRDQRPTCRAGEPSACGQQLGSRH